MIASNLILPNFQNKKSKYSEQTKVKPKVTHSLFLDKKSRNCGEDNKVLFYRLDLATRSNSSFFLMA